MSRETNILFIYTGMVTVKIDWMIYICFGIFVWDHSVVSVNFALN